MPKSKSKPASKPVKTIAKKPAKSGGGGGGGGAVTIEACKS